MGLSIEVLPTKPLSPNWDQQLCERLVLLDETVTFDKIFENAIRVFVNQSALFDVWFAKKERSIYTDEDYLEGFKGLEKIDVPLFLEKFRKIDYSIRLEIKISLEYDEKQLTLNAAKEIARLSEGIVFFDHTIGAYIYDHFYVISDFE
jgi:hypothetical protein